MKKVFACLSALVLMLVTFGLLVQPAHILAAEVEDGKFIEDPTLEEGEMPLYVMNSIQTSFPHLYDFNAQPDPNYMVGRDYYWNEIKLVFPEFGDSGATGRFWSVYTQGEYDEDAGTAAASKVYLWIENQFGEIVTATSTRGSIVWREKKDDKYPDDPASTYAPLFGDVSLSGVRYNVSGKPVVMDNYQLCHGIINGGNIADQYSSDPFFIIVDGNGKVVRGHAHDNYFAAENIETYGYNPVFGYKDGVIVVRSDVVGGQALHGLSASDAELDREQIAVPDMDSPVLDDFGDPVLGADGQPTYNDKYVDGENPSLLTGTRYIFQWFSEEEFANEKVNTVGYMQEGWLADRWDYAYADPNGGYVCLSFTAALGKYNEVTADQARIHNASVRALEAAGELSAEEAAALLIKENVSVDETTGAEVITYGTYRRPETLQVTVPVNGIMYRYGYLDYSGAAVVPMHFEKYCHLFEDALIYGRHADYQAYARTYNFSATGLVAQNAVYENESFYVREENGEYIFEVKQGSNIKVSEIIDILGMLGGYETFGKPAKEAGSNVPAVISYKQSDADGLEYTMDIDGKPTMRPVQYSYETIPAATAAFMDAFAPYIGASTYTYENWSANIEGKVTQELIDKFFVDHPEWDWFKRLYETEFNAKKEGAKSEYEAWSVYGVRQGLTAFYCQIEWGTWPYSPNFSTPATINVTDYSPEKAYKYETWDEFIADFLKDFNNEVYGKEQVTSPAKFQDLTWLADPAGETAKKMCAFFESAKWSWLGQAITAGVNAAGWTSYDKTDYRYYRFNAAEYINKASTGMGCGEFVNMPDPDCIGKPLEKNYNKIIYSTEGYNLFDTFELTLKVVNNATTITDEIAVKFQIVEHFTPVIKVDEAALKVALGQKSINLEAAVTAWDMEYKESGNGVYGSDISRQYLEFVYPEGFDPNNLRGGEWVIEAVAKCPYETGITERVSFKVLVIDENAPTLRLSASDFYVPQGSVLTINDILAFAHDDVHGDLLRNAEIDWIWYNINFGGYDPEYSEVGEQFSCSVTIYDAAMNSSKATFTLTVTGMDIELPEVPVVDPEKGEGEGEGEGEKTESCVSFAYVSSFIAAAGLALLILKKRH